MSELDEARSRRRKQSRIRRTLHRAGWIRRSSVLRALRRLAASLPTSGNDVRIFHDGDLLFAQMIEDIRAARERVSIEMYMLRHDRTGRRIARALCDKASAGVPVRLIFDAVGSLGISGTFLRTLTDAGVLVVPYHFVAPWRQRYALFRRNHRKTVVVDGRIGYTGGVNFGDQWAGRRRGGSAWRDSHARVVGAAAGDLEVLFEETWFQETGEVLNLPRAVPRQAESATSLTRKESLVYVVASRGGPDRRVRRLFLLALAHARRRISITSSYFIPDRGLRRAMYRAAERGVDVRVLVPEQSDVPVTLWASNGLLGKMLKRGIKIYRWQPTILHAKTMVIDGHWCTVGTSNLDHISLNRNLEANLLVISAEVGADLEARFERDLRFSRRLEFEEWQQRPWFARVRDRLARLIRWLL